MVLTREPSFRKANRVNTMKVRPPLCFQVMLIALGCTCALPTLDLRGQDRDGAPRADNADDAAGKDLRKRRMDDMRRRAQSTIVFRIDGEKRTRADLVAEPVLRFSSDYFGIIDATFWLYGTKGRPVAAQAIELFRPPILLGYYYCLESLIDQPIEVRWPGQPEWSSTKPGLQMSLLPDTPRPASSEAARTRQIKAIAHRFACTRIDFNGVSRVRAENRIFSQPIYRYRDPDGGIQDGAILVGVETGTSPDFLILLEARGTDLEHASWYYGPRRTTTGELHLRFDGKEVWSVPWEYVPGRNVYGTHVHFPIYEKYDE